MQPKQYLHQLKSTGAETVAIDVTSSSRKATFKFDNVPTRLGNEWCFAQKLRVYVRTHLTHPSGGSAAFEWDDYFRALTSIKLASDDLGVLYGEGDLNGPALGLIAAIVSAGYKPAWPPMPTIGTGTASTPDLIIPFDIPLGHECFYKGHQTGIWTGFLKNNGQLEINLASSAWPTAVDGGSTAGATTDVRCELLYTSEPEARPPAIWHWRMHSTNANEKKHTIKDLCQGSGIKGASGIGKLAFLAYLSSVKGLGGAGTIDNILRVFPRDRGQPSFDLGTPFYAAASLLGHFTQQIRHKLGAPLTGSAITYPLGLDAITVAGAAGFMNTALAYFLPYFWPDADGQMVSKLQEASGDYYIEQDYTAVPAAQAQWLTLEQSYLTQQQEEFLIGSRMGIPVSQVKRYAKTDKALKAPKNQADASTQQGKLRGIPKKIAAK